MHRIVTITTLIGILVALPVVQAIAAEQKTKRPPIAAPTTGPTTPSPAAGPPVKGGPKTGVLGGDLPVVHLPGVPTDNINNVALAIKVEHKNLTTRVSVKRGLALTQPVTISIGYLGSAVNTLGQQQERQTKTYDPFTGTWFVYDEPEGNGQPRRVHMDITLSEPKPGVRFPEKGGGAYSYNVPVDVDLNPVYYDVSIGPLLFTLLSDCALIGDSGIDFMWTSPDTPNSPDTPQKWHFPGVGFKNSPGEHRTIGAFQWSRAEVSASENLMSPDMIFDTANLLSGYENMLRAFLGGGPYVFSHSNPRPFPLVPGVSRHVTVLMDHVNPNCSARGEYDITYQVHSYRDVFQFPPFPP